MTTVWFWGFFFQHGHKCHLKIRPRGRVVVKGRSMRFPMRHVWLRWMLLRWLRHVDSRCALLLKGCWWWTIGEYPTHLLPTTNGGNMESGSSCVLFAALQLSGPSVLLHRPFFHVQAVTYPGRVRQHRKPLNYFTTFIVGSVVYSSSGSHFNIHGVVVSN